ncbi:MAG: hypothetical protein PVG39_25040 [Desulfobacteraceae bacterium]
MKPTKNLLMLQYTKDHTLQEMSRELAIAALACGMPVDLPTTIFYENVIESRLIKTYGPDKLAELVYNALSSWGECMGWKATVLMSNGQTSVLIGNKDVIDPPNNLANVDTIGSC